MCHLHNWCWLNRAIVFAAWGQGSERLKCPRQDLKSQPAILKDVKVEHATDRPTQDPAQDLAYVARTMKYIVCRRYHAFYIHDCTSLHTRIHSRRLALWIQPQGSTVIRTDSLVQIAPMSNIIYCLCNSCALDVVKKTDHRLSHVSLVLVRSEYLTISVDNCQLV